MKIAIATAVYYPMTNGVATFSYQLAKGLASRGHEVLVLTPSLTGKSHTETQDGVKVHYLNSTKMPLYPDQIEAVPKKRLFYKNGMRVSLAPYKDMFRALKKFKPDVIHSQTPEMIGFAAYLYAKQYRVPLVTTGHNYPEVVTGQMKAPTAVKKPLNKVLRAYFLNFQKHSDYTTMPTELVMEDMVGERKFPIPVEALSNGIDIAAFRPGRASAEIYDKYKIPRGRPVALYVGRVDPEKNVGKIILAFQDVLKILPMAVLVVVGDGTDLMRLKSLAAEREMSDAVIFTGRVLPPELMELYRVGSVFVTASEMETQGIVLIEAAATGLPLVAVDKGGVREICRDGINGYLCQPGNSDEAIRGMTENIVKILKNKDLAKSFREKSLKIAKINDIRHTLNRFEEIYREVISLKRA